MYKEDELKQTIDNIINNNISKRDKITFLVNLYVRVYNITNNYERGKRLESLILDDNYESYINQLVMIIKAIEKL